MTWSKTTTDRYRVKRCDAGWGNWVVISPRTTPRYYWTRAKARRICRLLKWCDQAHCWPDSYPSRIVSKTIGALSASKPSPDF